MVEKCYGVPEGYFIEIYRQIGAHASIYKTEACLYLTGVSGHKVLLLGVMLNSLGAA